MRTDALGTTGVISGDAGARLGVERAWAEPGRAAFRGALGQALARGGAGGERSAREAAEELVAVALVQPILQQVRESNDAAAPFAPGDAERRFGPLLDAEIAHRIVHKSGYGLVDAVEAALTSGGSVKGVDRHG